MVAAPLFRGVAVSLPECVHPEGAIVELAGDEVSLVAAPDTARATIYFLLKQHGLDPSFPDDVMAEVAAIQCAPGIDDDTLEDLTGLAFVTIDNEDSLDLDQALHIERTDAGGFLVRYALADAAYYVRSDTALFREALARGSSYYLPGLSVPMLPRVLSEDVVSLNPGVARRALVFEMTLDGDGNPIDTQLVRARIRSRAKLSYNGVQQLHDRAGDGTLTSEPYEESLRLLRVVGELRIDAAQRRNVVCFHREEAEVGIDADGERFQLQREQRNAVSRWNEQISLLCNMLGALFVAHGRVPNPEVQPIFRVHQSPSRERLAELSGTLQALVEGHGLDRSWCWRDRGEHRESLAAYLERLTERVKASSQDHERRILATIERQLLVTNRRSMFTEEPGLHFALKVRPYARFSSPMREIVGIFTHKEALEKLQLDAPAPAEEDERLREEVIDAANRAKSKQSQIERDLGKLAVDQLFQTEVDGKSMPTHCGTILGVRASRLYVRLDEPPIELKVYTQFLNEHFDAEFVLDERGVSLVDTRSSRVFRLGDAIVLECRGYDAEPGRWRLVPRVADPAESV